MKVEEFIKNPPRLKNLKSLIIDDEFSLCKLDWVLCYPLLESLTIANHKEIDLAPLQEMKHLLDLNLLDGESNPKVINANFLPLSLESLHLDECYVDPVELNHLKLKKLSLNSKYITDLPEKSALSNLEYLNLSGSSISNLSPIAGNQNLKIFIYRYPRRSGLKANFSVLSSLSNLEELDLFGFPQTNKDLENAIKGLSKLKILGLSGKKLSDLSFLEGWNVATLIVGGRLLNLMPVSVLANPNLIYLDTKKLERLDSTFCWDKVSPNIQCLNLGDSDFFDFSQISRFPLVSLDCQNVGYIDNEEKLIAFAPTLEFFNCKGSTIYSLVSKYGDDILRCFTKLKYLSIDFSENDKFNSLEFLKKFPVLEELQISLVSKFPVEAYNVFLEMPNLKKIDITFGSLDVYRKIKELLKNDNRIN